MHRALQLTKPRSVFTRVHMPTAKIVGANASLFSCDSISRKCQQDRCSAHIIFKIKIEINLKSCALHYLKAMKQTVLNRAYQRPHVQIVVREHVLHGHARFARRRYHCRCHSTSDNALERLLCVLKQRSSDCAEKHGTTVTIVTRQAGPDPQLYRSK